MTIKRGKKTNFVEEINCIEVYALLLLFDV